MQVVQIVQFAHISRASPARQRLRHEDSSLGEPDFLEIIARSLAVDDQEVAFLFQDQKRTVPDIARIVDALPAGGAEGAQRVDGGCGTRFGDDDQPIMILQRIEGLAAEWMALDQTDLDRQRPWLAVEQADDSLAIFGIRVDVRQIMKAFGIALVDRIVMGTRHLDHIAEAREALTRERFDLKPW